MTSAHATTPSKPHAFVPQRTTWRCDEPLALECGARLDGFVLDVTTLGRLAPSRDNVVWVLHPLTCTADFTDWWGAMVGPGKALDPTTHFIVCANTLGSCHGSTGPANVGDPAFPRITMRDVTVAMDRLRAHLGIARIALGIGGSYGGQQLFEWLVQSPQLFAQACIIGASDRQSPWAIAFGETQRMALEADPSFGTTAPGAGAAGLAAARAIAMLSYRNAALFAATQTDADDRLDGYRAASYQRAAGERFAARFDALSYRTLLDVMDSHNVHRGRGSRAAVLAQVSARCLLVALEGDVLYPTADVFSPARLMPAATCVELPCDHGHDSILTHAADLSSLVTGFMRAAENAHATDRAQTEVA